MEKDVWTEIQPILDRALTLQGEKRSEFVEMNCAHDPDLCSEINALLDSIEQAEPFWEKLLENNSAFTDELIHSHKPHSLLELPQILDTYRLVSLLGKGGMSDVYLAKRGDGLFEQDVAVKIVRDGLNLQEQILRFRQERQILAKLNHPNIAGLLDGGVTEEGLPYLVMEYVDGIPITEYCLRNNCSLQQRLTLFKQVCEAVRHAHQHLIVHRDLKPANILVTSHGNVKVLDFGIAKLLDQTLTGQDLLETRAGLRLMSLSFAAPEQLTGEPITTATDVYALGLLLYELLTGRPPLELNGLSWSEAEQLIRKVEPDKPSRVSQNDREGLEGDLDSIILKALRKEPGMRYESAGQILEELERYSRNEPVQARRDTLVYRLTKFYKRNAAAVLATAFMLIVLVGFVSYHTWQVTAERNIAERESQLAGEVSDFLVELFSSANPERNQGDEPSATELLQKGKEKIDELSDQPEIQARLLSTMGLAYAKAGYYYQADSLLQQSLTLTESVHGHISMEAAEALHRLGILYRDQRRYETALPYYRKSLAVRKKLGRAGDLQAAGLMQWMGENFRDTGQIDSAELYIAGALDIYRAFYPDNHDELIYNKHSLAYLYRAQEKYREAEKLYLEILQQLEQSGADDPSFLSRAQNNVAFLYMEQERFAEAETYYRASLASAIDVYGEGHPNVLMIMGNLAGVLSYQQKWTLEEEVLLQRINFARSRFGNDNWRTGSAIERLATSYLREELPRFEDALPLLDESIAIYSETIGADHNWTLFVQLKKSYCMQRLNLAGFENLFEETYATLENRADWFSPTDKVNLEKVAAIFTAFENKNKAQKLLALNEEE